MKLEVGKSYRTRDGREAEVQFVDTCFTSDSCCRFEGIISGEYESRSWRHDGRYHSVSETGHDLVAPWSEPSEPKESVIRKLVVWEPQKNEPEPWRAHLIPINDEAVGIYTVNKDGYAGTFLGKIILDESGKPKVVSE